MASDERTELEVIIKSIAISSPRQLTVEQLNKDFRSEMGYSIPFRKMGYSNLEAFLRSLNKSIEIIGCGCDAMVATITSEKSKHIHDMVRNQKKPRMQKKDSKKNGVRYNYPKFANGSNPKKRESPMSINSSSNSSRINVQHSKPFVRNLIFNTQNHNTLNGNKITQQKHITVPRSCSGSKDTHITHENNNLEKDFVSKLQITSVEKNCVKLIDIDEPACSTTSDIPKLVNKTQAITLNNSTHIPSITDINQTELEEAIPKYAIDKRVLLLDLMDHNVVFGHSIPHYKLPRDLKRLDVKAIYITEVHNPFKFWFHFHKENHALDTLMNEMEIFYESLTVDMFTMPPNAIIPGEVCATLYNNIWHRARIVSYITNYKVKVFFVDYGTVCEVDISYIKYLNATFAEIPSQAIRGCLSYLKPRGLHWSYEATKYFFNLVQELLLYAQVSEVDNVDGVVYMVLCDTNNSDVIQINKSLVQRGFAMVDPQWFNEQVTQKCEKSKRYRHLRENFPTFSMLENAEYPSYVELLDLLDKGIDYEQIVDSSLFHPGVLSVPSCVNRLPFQLLNTNPFRFEILIAAADI